MTLGLQYVKNVDQTYQTVLTGAMIATMMKIKFFDNIETITKNTALKYDSSVNVLNQELLYKMAKLSIYSKINKNRAKSAGGGIYLQESKYESSNCTFKDNQPDDVYKEKD